MNKLLYLVRHAKSDWSVPGQKDFDRTLNARGLSDAPKMGKKLNELGVNPEIIISSPAQRAKMTSLFFAEQLNYNPEHIVFEPEIYEASVRTLLQLVNNLDDNYRKVMLFGHNPGFTYFAEYLTKEEIGNIPTSGVVEIELEVSSWKEVSGDLGKLKMFIYPKKFL
ncbi:MAG TPA: histidine phosphatase family protein [Cytophagaceae bacterium]